MGIGTCFTHCFIQKSSSPTRGSIELEEGLNVENVRLYSYKDLQIASEDFSPVNKIGRGGFGSVYKGKLKDGTMAAIKVLSAESNQGVREFLTEIVTISGLEHENLVKLHGCCAEGHHRILVYGYLENNSLDQTLLGGRRSSIQFSWKTRTKISIGIARGLAYLHEEVQPHVIHRDIKASNILLDKDLTPKISDFGLAKLFPSNVTHVSTRVAGTLGYLAPEYAVRGQLTRKADIYSFGVLLLEIISGRCNTIKRLPVGEQFLLEKVWALFEKGELLQLVDPDLGDEVDFDEASRLLKISLLCTQEIPKNRPSMSTVVKMLTGEVDLDDKQITRPGTIEQLMLLRHNNTTTSTASAGSGKKANSSSSESTTTTYPSISFTSIYDREP